MATTIDSTPSIVELYNPAQTDSKTSVRYVSVRTVLVLLIAVGAVIAIFSVWGGFGLGGLYLFGVIAAPIALAGVVGRVVQTAQAIPRTITLENGVFKIEDAKQQQQSSMAACCWFVGRASDDSSLSCHTIRTKVIVVVLPDVAPRRENVACGFTPEFYDRWKAALTDYGCRRVLRQEGLLGVCFGLLVIGSCVLGGVLGWHLGVLILRNVMVPAQINGVANVFPAVTAILFSWILAIVPWMLPSWRRHTVSENLAFQRSAVLFPLKLAIPAGVMLAGNLLAGLLVAVILMIAFLFVSRWLSRTPHSKSEGDKV